jgi:hypothetical protein
VSRGDHIAQIICQNICYPALEEVTAQDVTERGEGGLGLLGYTEPLLTLACFQSFWFMYNVILILRVY